MVTATIINVAVPDIMGAFGVGQDQAQWLSTAYLASMTSSMLLVDWAVRRIGARATFVIAMSCFIIGSLTGSLATEFDVVVVGRIMQGAAAGVTQPLAMMTMFQIFPPDRRGRAMGLFGLVIIFAPAIGPWLGGVAIDTFDWRYAFYLPLPLCVTSAILAGMFLQPRDDSLARPPFDWLGFALLLVFVTTLLVGLTNGVKDGWGSDEIMGLLITAAFSFVGFITWQVFAPHALLNMTLFVNPRFAAAAVVSFIFGAAIFGSLYLVPVFVQLVQGYSPTQSGIMQFPGGVAMAIVFPIVGRLTDFGRENWMTVFGLAVVAYSLFLMVGAHTDTPYWTFVSWLVLSRVGLAFIFPSLSAGSLRALPSQLVGQGSGTMNFVRSLGGAFGVNLASIIVEQSTAEYRSVMINSQTLANPQTAEWLDKAREILGHAGLPDALQELAARFFLGQTVTSEALMLAFRDGFLFLGLVTLIALVPGWFISPGRVTAPAPKDEPEAALSPAE